MKNEAYRKEYAALKAEFAALAPVTVMSLMVLQGYWRECSELYFQRSVFLAVSLILHPALVHG